MHVKLSRNLDQRRPYNGFSISPFYLFLALLLNPVLGVNAFPLPAIVPIIIILIIAVYVLIRLPDANHFRDSDFWSLYIADHRNLAPTDRAGLVVLKHVYCTLLAEASMPTLHQNWFLLFVKANDAFCFISVHQVYCQFPLLFWTCETQFLHFIISRKINFLIFYSEIKDCSPRCSLCS